MSGADCFTIPVRELNVHFRALKHYTMKTGISMLNQEFSPTNCHRKHPSIEHT